MSKNIFSSFLARKSGRRKSTHIMGFFFYGLPLESIELLMILVLPWILHFAFIQHLLQPRVISEIVSGIILGPSCLGQIHGFSALFFSSRSLSYLQTMSQIGAMLWLFMTGLHLKGDLIYKQRWQAIASAFTTIGLAFVIACGLATLFGASTYTNSNPTQLILLMVVLLSVPDEAVMTRVLAERGLLSSKFASICTATGTVGLPICFLLLTVILNQAPNDSSSTVDPLPIALIVLGSALVLIVTKRFLVPRLTQRVILKGRMEPFVFAAAMVLCFSAAWFTQALTASFLLGPFFLGLFAFPSTGTLFCQNIESTLRPITTGILLPVFFAFVGLKTDFTLLEIFDILQTFWLFGALLVRRLRWHLRLLLTTEIQEFSFSCFVGMQGSDGVHHLLHLFQHGHHHTALLYDARSLRLALLCGSLPRCSAPSEGSPPPQEVQKPKTV